MKQLKDKEYEELQQYQYNKVHGYIWTPDTLDMICSGNEYDPEKIGKQMLEKKVKFIPASGYCCVMTAELWRKH